MSLGVLPSVTAQEIDLETFLPFETENGWVTLLYPPDWVIEEYEGAVLLANAAEVLERVNGGEAAQSGDVFITLAMLPSSYAALLGIESDELDVLAQGFFDAFIPNSPRAAEPEIIAYDEDIEFGQIVFTGRRGDGMIVVFQPAEGILGMAIIGIAADDVEDVQDLIHTIIATIEFTATPEELLASLAN